MNKPELVQSCVKKFQLETIGKEIEKTSNGIYPLRDVHVRKFKVVKSPEQSTTTTSFITNIAVI